MKRSLFLVLILMVGISTVFAQSDKKKNKKTEVVKIAASMDCISCKAKIENDLAYVPGVIEVVGDVKSKIVTVIYKPSKTNPEALVERIKKLGYEAYVYKEGEPVQFSDH